MKARERGTYVLKCIFLYPVIVFFCFTFSPFLFPFVLTWLSIVKIVDITKWVKTGDYDGTKYPSGDEIVIDGIPIFISTLGTWALYAAYIIQRLNQ